MNNHETNLVKLGWFFTFIAFIVEIRKADCISIFERSNIIRGRRDHMSQR